MLRLEPMFRATITRATVLPGGGAAELEFFEVL